MDKVVNTTVIDAGARYGLHPTWEDYNAPLQYYAFEPDEEEATRLKQVEQEGYRVIPKALANTDGERTLSILNHRGLSTLLKPEMINQEFEDYRPGQTTVIDQQQVKTTTIDNFARQNGLEIDFLKIDTEGTELAVLKGSEEELQDNILGVRSSACFKQYYKAQKLFNHIHDYLLSQKFYLLNLDYEGYGVPRNFLFRKPDPRQKQEYRYGELMHSDGVWLKEIDAVLENADNKENQLLKYSYFCMLNNAPDVGIDVLLDYENNHEGLSEEIKDKQLYNSLRKHCAKFLGQWRAYPDEEWDKVKEMFESIFDFELKGGSEFWPQIQKL